MRGSPETKHGAVVVGKDGDDDVGGKHGHGGLLPAEGALLQRLAGPPGEKRNKFQSWALGVFLNFFNNKK